MPTDNFKKELSTTRVTTLKSKPEMCGWALLQMAADKRQSQQNKSPESLEKELSGLTQADNSKY